MLVVWLKVFKGDFKEPKIYLLVVVSYLLLNLAWPKLYDS